MPGTLSAKGPKPLALHGTGELCSEQIWVFQKRSRPLQLCVSRKLPGLAAMLLLRLAGRSWEERQPRILFTWVAPSCPCKHPVGCKRAICSAPLSENHLPVAGVTAVQLLQED